MRPDPRCGHVRTFKAALSASGFGAGGGGGGGAGNKRKKGDKNDANRNDSPPMDLAEAIKQAMAASIARGGGSLGGGAWRDENSARPTAAGRVALGANGDAVVGSINARVGLAEEAEIHDLLRHFRSQDYLRMLGLPGAPVVGGGGGTAHGSRFTTHGSWCLDMCVCFEGVGAWGKALFMFSPV